MSGYRAVIARQINNGGKLTMGVRLSRARQINNGCPVIIVRLLSRWVSGYRARLSRGYRAVIAVIGKQSTSVQSRRLA
jgi:hypothetical protein